MTPAAKFKTAYQFFSKNSTAGCRSCFFLFFSGRCLVVRDEECIPSKTMAAMVVREKVSS
jgi:hypothetical protein